VRPQALTWTGVTDALPVERTSVPRGQTSISYLHKCMGERTDPATTWTLCTQQFGLTPRSLTHARVRDQQCCNLPAESTRLLTGRFLCTGPSAKARQHLRAPCAREGHLWPPQPTPPPSPTPLRHLCSPPTPRRRPLPLPLPLLPPAAVTTTAFSAALDTTASVAAVPATATAAATTAAAATAARHYRCRRRCCLPRRHHRPLPSSPRPFAGRGSARTSRRVGRSDFLGLAACWWRLHKIGSASAAPRSASSSFCRTSGAVTAPPDQVSDCIVYE
jgi:hypothetical protein